MGRSAPSHPGHADRHAASSWRLDSRDTRGDRRSLAATWDDWRTREHRREAAIKRLLRHLTQFPGESWQQRWEVSGLDEPGNLVRDLERAEDRGRSTITGGLEALLCLRVIRPSLPAMRSNKFLAYAKTFRVAQDDPLLDIFFKQITSTEASRISQHRALFDVCCALTTQGIALADLTPEAFLFYAKQCRELAGVVNTSTTRFTGHLAGKSCTRWSTSRRRRHGRCGRRCGPAG